MADSSKPLLYCDSKKQWIAMENKLKGISRKMCGMRSSRNDSSSEIQEIEFNDALEK